MPCACIGNRRYAHKRCLHLRIEIPREACINDGAPACHTCGQNLEVGNEDAASALGSYADTAYNIVFVGAAYYTAYVALR